MKTTVLNYDELQALILPLMAEDKWFIDIRPLPDDGGYSVEWREHLSYKAEDGSLLKDEVWLDKNGVASFVQELSEEDCRNIVRMILKEDRRKQELVDQMLTELAGAVNVNDLLGTPEATNAEHLDGDPDDDTIDSMIDSLFPASMRPSGKPTLH